MVKGFSEVGMSEILDDCFLNKKEVIEIVKLSRSTIDKYEKEGKFPKKTRLGHRIVRWRKSEIMRWLDEQVA